VKTRVVLAMKNGVCLLQKKYVGVQSFIATKKIKAKIKMLQEKCIAYEAIKI
jgi:hypothetical protein